MESLTIEVPAELIPLTMETERNLLNAMLIYPAIRSGKISYGKAAEILGLKKFNLIKIYGEMGIPYFNLTESELEEDLTTLKNLRAQNSSKFVRKNFNSSRSFQRIDRKRILSK